MCVFAAHDAAAFMLVLRIEMRKDYLKTLVYSRFR